MTSGTPTGVADQRLKPALAALSQGQFKVLSIDVFDTLLWRRVPEPSDVFLVLGQQLKDAGHLADHISPIAFAELRRAAQTSARERAFAATGSREVTLADIYAELPDIIFNGTFSAERREASELECERGLMLLDRDVVALMRQAKDIGARIILVSDTYFSSETIQDFLHSAGFEDESLTDRLFVSCEMGRPKFIDLFDIVLKELGVDASDLIHVGDNLTADIHPCQARGISCVHYDKWNFSPRAQNKEIPEARIERAPYIGVVGDRGLAGLRSRLYHRPPTDKESDQLLYWQYGASVLAPIFASYARWVVETCQNEKASHIFGVMREGRFLSQLVSETAAKLKVDLSTEELWLSRRAVIRAALYDDDLSALPEAISLSPGLSKEEILAGLSLEVGEVDGVFNTPFDWTAADAIPTLSQAIAQTPPLRTKVVKHSTELRQNLLAGLGKQIDLSQAATVFVMDLGYAATIQTVLTKILRREGARVQLRGLYLALNAKAASNAAAGAELRAYLDHEGFKGPTAALLSRTPDVLEHACMCREGSLSHYDERGKPVLLPNQRDKTQLLQMEAVQRGILDGVNAVNHLFGNLAANPSDDVHLKNQVSGIIEAALLYPTHAEASSVGAWIHEANFDLADRRRLSDLAMDVSQLEYNGWQVLQNVGRNQCYWPAAALTLINPFAADVYAAGVRGEYNAEHLTSGPLLGHISICPDLGVGFDSKQEGAVPLSVNAFGRGEITAALKPLGPQIYQRLRLRFPKVAAHISVDQVTLNYVGEGEGKTIVLKPTAHERAFTWSGVQVQSPGFFATGEEDIAVFIDLESVTPAWLHGLNFSIRFRYLRIDPLFS